MGLKGFLADFQSTGDGEQHQERSKPRQSIIAIALVMVVGLVLRFIMISDRGIWYDDAFSIFLARRSLVEIVAGTAADTMPPLYYFLLHFWMRAGETIAWIRLLNVIISLAVILLVYLWTKQLFGHQAGFWAGLVTAVSPMQIYHAQEVRMYALLELAQLGYILFFLSTLTSERGTARWKGAFNWAGLVLCGSAAMYTHNLAIFVLVVPNLILLVWRRLRNLMQLLAAQAAIVALAIPWLVLIPGQIDKIQRAFWTPQPGVVEILQAIVVFTAALPLPGIWQVIAVLLSIEAFVLVALAVGKTVLSKRHGSEDGHDPGLARQVGLVVFFALAPPALLLIASYVMRPVFVPRGFLLSSLAYYVLIAWMVADRTNRIGGWLATGALLAAAVISLPFQYTYKQFPRSPYADATAWLEKNMVTGERVIHDNKLSYFPSIFYTPHLDQVFLGDEPGSHNDTFAAASQTAMGIFPQGSMQEAVDGFEQIYFIVFEKTIQEYLSAGRSNHPQLIWLDSCYDLVEQVAFEDLFIYHYAKIGICMVED